MSDDFYIGWQDSAPRSIAAFTKWRALALLALVAGLGLLVGSSQPPSANSRFEFGTVRTFEGRIELNPYPMLLVVRPGVIAPESAAESRWLLTVFGKAGAESRVGHLAGHRVRLDGTLIDRDGVTMVEIADSTVEDLGLDTGTAATSREAESGEIVTLRGEIVDSKCYLGVMKPGHLKTHRACAVRCISGGVPPVLLVRDGEGRATYYLLTDERGGSVNMRVLDLVAEPVEITGRIVELAGEGPRLLRADPATYRRVESP